MSLLFRRRVSIPRWSGARRPAIVSLTFSSDIRTSGREVHREITLIVQLSLKLWAPLTHSASSVWVMNSCSSRTNVTLRFISLSPFVGNKNALQHLRQTQAERGKESHGKCCNILYSWHIANVLKYFCSLNSFRFTPPFIFYLLTSINLWGKWGSGGRDTNQLTPLGLKGTRQCKSRWKIKSKEATPPGE